MIAVWISNLDIKKRRYYKIGGNGAVNVEKISTQRLQVFWRHKEVGWLL